MCEWTMAFAMVCRAKILFPPSQLDSSEGALIHLHMRGWQKEKNLSLINVRKANLQIQSL